MKNKLLIATLLSYNFMIQPSETPPTKNIFGKLLTWNQEHSKEECKNSEHGSLNKASSIKASEEKALKLLTYYSKEYLTTIESSSLAYLKDQIKDLPADTIEKIFTLAYKISYKKQKKTITFNNMHTALYVYKNSLPLTNDIYKSILIDLLGENEHFIDQSTFNQLLPTLKALNGAQIKEIIDSYYLSSKKTKDVDTIYLAFYTATSDKNIIIPTSRLRKIILKHYFKTYKIPSNQHVTQDLINNHTLLTAKEIEYSCKQIHSQALSNQRTVKLDDLIYSFYKSRNIYNKEILELLIKSSIPEESTLYQKHYFDKTTNLIESITAENYASIIMTAHNLVTEKNSSIINYEDFITAYYTIFNSKKPDYEDHHLIINRYLKTTKALHNNLNENEIHLVARALEDFSMEEIEEFIYLVSSKNNRVSHLKIEDFLKDYYFYCKTKNKLTTTAPYNSHSTKFFKKLHKVLFYYFLKKYDYNLPQNFCKRFLNDIAPAKPYDIEELIKNAYKKAYLSNNISPCINDINLEESLDELNIPYKRSLIIHTGLNDFNSVIQAEYHDTQTQRIQLKTKIPTLYNSHNSSGYHAVKNANIIHHIIRALPKERREAIKYLSDFELADRFFGNENTLWRKSIIQKRKAEIAKLFMYEILLTSVTGPTVIHHTKDQPSNTESYCLPFHQGWIEFKDFENNIDYNTIERTLLCKTIATIAEHLAHNASYEIDNEQIIIENNKIIEAFLTILKEDRDLNNLEALKKYIPNIEHISFEISLPHLLKENYTNRQLSEQFIKPYLIGRSQRTQENLMGESLTAHEIKDLLNLEQPYFSSSIQENIAHIHAVLDEKDTQNLEAALEKNSNLKAIRDRLQSLSSRFVGSIIISDQGQWLNCIVNKQGAYKQYICANSNSNILILDHPEILKILNLLENTHVNKSLIKEETNTEEDFAPITEFINKENPLTLDLFFNGNVPSIVSLFIQAIKNPAPIIAAQYQLLKPLLLSGPPSIDKNIIAQHIAQQANCGFMCMPCMDFISHYKNSIVAFKKLLKYASQSEQSIVIFFDEIEKISSQANSQKTPQYGANALNLESLIDTTQVYKGKIFLIGSTDSAENIHAPLKDKFNEVKLHLPDAQTREKIIEYYLAKNNISNISPAFKIELTQATRNFNIKKIENMINNTMLSLLLKNPVDKPFWHTYTFNAIDPSGWWSDYQGGFNKLVRTLQISTSLTFFPFGLIAYSNPSNEEKHLYWSYANNSYSFNERIRELLGNNIH